LFSAETKQLALRRPIGRQVRHHEKSTLELYLVPAALDELQPILASR